MTDTNIFFDSWGNAWSPCDCEHSDAEAFGPSGCARRRADVASMAGRPAADTGEDEQGWNDLNMIRSTIPDVVGTVDRESCGLSRRAWARLGLREEESILPKSLGICPHCGRPGLMFVSLDTDDDDDDGGGDGRCRRCLAGVPS